MTDLTEMKYTSMNSEKIIEVHGLTKKFKNITAVNELNFTVYKGDIFGFLGPNGAGKSTTIRMLLSLIKPTSGSIRIFGKSLKKQRPEILKKTGAIVEKPDFYLYLSAYQNLEVLAKISGIHPAKKRIFEMLELVKLTGRADSKVKTFSHGMKQRLGIAQALLHDPELIILDEPTTGLDPQGMKEVRDLIVHLAKEQGKTILLSSHILKEIEEVATRMLIINNGRTQVEGEVSSLLDTENISVTIEVENSGQAVEKIAASPWFAFLKSQVDKRFLFEMAQDETADLIKYLTEGGIKIRAVIPRHSLEAYFLKITEGGN